MTETPLRIGFFSDVYTPQVNGVAVSLALLAGHLRRDGHEVTIFAPKFPGYHDAGREVYRLPSVRYMRLPPVYVAVPGTPRAALALRRGKFDVIHTHTPLTAGLLAYLSAHLKRVPLIYTYHTAITDYTHYLRLVGRTRLVWRAARRFSALTCNMSDYIVAPSAKFERLLLEQNVRQPIRVVPNGIELAPFQQPTPPGTFRRRLGLAQEAELLLTVGRIDPEKSLDFVIEAFSHVACRRPAARLVLAGDGSARAARQRQAAASGFVFPGMVNRAELPALFHDADLFLSGSTTEVHPLAMIEAIAAGLPVVAVWDEALKGMVADGVNGRVAPARQVGPFAAAISDLLQDHATRRAYGRASVELSQKYAIEAQAEMLLALYREAIVARSEQPARPHSFEPGRF
ncbi:MAG: glycosyltransferase [Chloroflexi bacterium]|nr:glycosyltransferase [Chloroflexota bacterium]